MSSKGQSKGSMPTISNRKAYYDYSIDEELEAGIVLMGCEVKMVRKGSLTLRDAFCHLQGGELWLVGGHIPEYPQASTHVEIDTRRRRKLLLHRSELKRLRRKLVEKGFTIVPLKAYFVHGRVKIKIGLAKGKRQYDKRQTIKQRDMTREDNRIRG